MKNLLIVFLSVLAVFTVCMAVNAQDVPVSVTVPEESYQVSIPTNELFLREEPTNLTVSATNVKLLTGNRLSVTVSSQNRFFLTAADKESGRESSIGYSMYYEIQKGNETNRCDVEQGAEILSLEGYGTAETTEPQNADVNLFLVLEKNGVNTATLAGKHTELGTVAVSNVRLPADTELVIAYKTGASLKTEDGMNEISYEIQIDEKTAGDLHFTQDGESETLYAAITKDAWDAAPAGSYSDTITFTASLSELAQ